MHKPDIRTKHPSICFLGLDSLYKIKNNPLEYYISLQKNYGDAVRVQLGLHRCWFLFHPNHIEQILTSKSDNFIRFERIMKILRQWNGDSLLISEGESWKVRRRKILPAFKQKRMPEYAKMITDQASSLTSQLENMIHTDCDIDALMSRYSLDIAGLTLFSKTFSSQSKEVSQAVHNLSEIAYRETTSPFLIPSFISMHINRHKRHVVQLMKRTIGDIVSQRLSSNTDNPNDLLSIIIDHHERDPNSIEEDVLSLLIAGHETTGATLSWLFILLSNHPKILQQVHDELDLVIRSDTPHYEHLKQLQFLGAVIHETLRLYPVAYALFCRQAKTNMDLGDFSLKKGDLVQLLPYVTHRDDRWFEEPDKFKPDRFLVKEDWPLYSYFPFGAGPRVCIGQSLGMMEIMLTAASILTRLSIVPKETLLCPHPRFSLRPFASSKVVFTNRKNI